ncbi:MAG: hypothetical protein NT067_06490 [Candidatus Diapherotrites archaeon]|nr:hypothetical protein [Candidatus Diapherotrites archaeon]
MEEPDVNSVQRRFRRFYRDDGTKLFDHLSGVVAKSSGMQDVEKQKIILSLKRQLEKTGDDEKKNLALHIFERASLGKDDAKEVVFNEVMKYQGRGKELSGKEADEIAESIYSQLKERNEAQKMLQKLDEKKRKEEEKLARETEKKIREKEKGLPRSKQRDMRGLGTFGVKAPEKTRRADSLEVEKIKQELSAGLGKGKKTEGGEEFSEIKKELGMKDESEEKEEDDSTFDELEKMSDEPGEGGPGESEEGSDEEFSMEGFETDLDSGKKKKKEEK